MSGNQRPKKDRRLSDLARIHILKKALLDLGGLTEDTYRDVLWVHGGSVESSAHLDSHGRSQVLKHLQALLDRAQGQKPKPYAGRPHNADAGRQQLKKIEALLADAGLPWTYAESIMKRQTRGRKQRLEFCDEGELAGIIAALERAALKRLALQLGAIFGAAWVDIVSCYAALLFGFDGTRDVSRYAEPQSQVLRWWAGQLQAACVWPVDLDLPPQCCQFCRNRQLKRRATGA